MKKRYQVFVSSTYADLVDERHRVIQTLLAMDCIPAGMELFPAADEEQFHFIKRVIDDCDYYILIIGGRYGSTTSAGVSYTEKEYEYAIERGLPVLAFIHDQPDDIPVGRSDIQPELRARLTGFRERVAHGRLVRFWHDARDLAGVVAVSLNNAIGLYPAVGWVRGDQLASTSEGDSRVVTVDSPRELVIRGASLVRRAVLRSFGPNGYRVGLTTPDGPAEHKRGSAIAQAIQASNALETIGVDYMRRFSEQVHKDVGDYTKLSLLISYAAMEHGQEALRGGLPSREFVLGIQRATEQTVQYLVSHAHPVCGNDIQDIGATAANGDRQIASLIQNAMWHAGKDGILTIEACESGKTQLLRQEGLQFECGYLSEHFVTDSQTRQCILDDCYLLLCDARLTNFRELLGVLEAVARTGRPLLVVADKVEGEVLATLVGNKLQGRLACAAVQAPPVGTQRGGFLTDIAVATGGKAVFADLDDISRVGLADLGRAARVILTADKTMIIGGMGPPDRIDQRADEIRAQIDITSDESQRWSFNVVWLVLRAD